MPEFDSHGRPRRYLYRHNPKTRSLRTCATCGEKFQHRGAVKFCSRACSAQSRVLTQVDLACLVCGEDYQAHPYRAESSKYCSKACWSRRAPTVACLACGHEFTAISNTRKKYCSRACAKKHMVGELASAWKDGASLRNERARHSNELRVWRLAVYKRDGYRCQDCGSKGHLHAHHIKFWSTHPELRFDVDNGRTLCIECHGRVHGKNFKPRGQTKIARRPEPHPAP